MINLKLLANYTTLFILTFSLSLNIVLIVLYFLRKNKKINKSESKELIDFISDLKIYGYGVVRIDPDSILYLSPKK